MEYAWAKFMQASKMSKKAISMFFNNLDLALIYQHLSYKILDEITMLLIELPHDKIIW